MLLFEKRPLTDLIHKNSQAQSAFPWNIYSWWFLCGLICSCIMIYLWKNLNCQPKKKEKPMAWVSPTCVSQFQYPHWNSSVFGVLLFDLADFFLLFIGMLSIALLIKPSLMDRKFFQISHLMITVPALNKHTNISLLISKRYSSIAFSFSTGKITFWHIVIFMNTSNFLSRRN